MSADAPAVREVRRRFHNPHPFAFRWETSEGRVVHAPGATVEVLMPADQPCPQALVEVLPPVKAEKPAATTPSEN